MSHEFIEAWFCHLEGKTPDEAVANALERAEEGGRFKQVLRFTDETGKIIDLIRRITALQKTSAGYSRRLEDGNPIFLHGLRIERITKKTNDKRAWLKELMIQRLGYAWATTQDQAEGPFRPLEDAERYELCTAARKSNCVVTFIRKGELLDKNAEVLLSLI